MSLYVVLGFMYVLGHIYAETEQILKGSQTFKKQCVTVLPAACLGCSDGQSRFHSYTEAWALPCKDSNSSCWQSKKAVSISEQCWMEDYYYIYYTIKD